MVITILDRFEAAAVAVADQICEAIAVKPTLVLGLPAGQTPIPLYTELRRRHVARRVDFSQVTTFNLDEFVGVSGDAPGSFRRFMNDHLFSGVNIHESRIQFLDGLAADLEAECLRYEQAVQACGGIDIQVLGIGANGHIGFNEPGDELRAATHVASLEAATREANADLFDGDASRVPESAMTMGVGTILQAREVILIAAGAAKARCVQQMIEGGVTPRVPASLLQLHARVRVFLDRSAALHLT